MYHNFKTTLYHGTVSEIQQINVNLGRERKDFGKGFYMAVSKKQAVGMMHKKYREVVRRSQGKQETDFAERLYEITLNTAVISELNIKIFYNADLEWLDFVLMCREKGGMPHDYDMVIGPTADDDTVLCLKVYRDGFYGKVGSDAAKRILLNNLETENLGIQYYIGKQDVADRLIADLRVIDWR
ncbi:MAG: DUF3990 domain-containing protein [Lachnospiraceae bacterium]|nr:DUF3990 domain-containing protein [Lachnospiraceae bacterium]